MLRDKEPEELRFQTQLLFESLSWFSWGWPAFFCDFPGFLPLQNLYLCLKALGIEEDPFNALQP